MFRLTIDTNNLEMAAQVLGAVAGIVLGWAITGSPIGGFVGGLIGLTLTTVALSTVQQNASTKNRCYY